MSKIDRKLDTRNKIMMGGLIVKANLDYLHQYDREVLLGLMIDAYNRLHSSEGDSYFKYYKELGRIGFNTTTK